MPGVPWTEAEKLRLTELVRARHGPLSIHRLGVFGSDNGHIRSANSIAQQMRRMRLVPEDRSMRARLAHQRGTSISEKARFDALECLKREGDAIPVDVVAMRYGVTVSWVRRTLKQLGISRSWAQTVSHPLSRFKDDRYRTQVSLRVSNWMRDRNQKRREHLVSLRDSLKAGGRRRECRCCQECGEEWPLGVEFFPATRSTRNGRVYYLHICRLCTGNRRKQRQSGGGDMTPRTLRLKRAMDARRVEVRLMDSRPAEKRCITCWQDWPVSGEFWRSTRLPSGNTYYEPRCRLCQNEKRREEELRRRSRQGSMIAGRTV